MAAYRIPSLDGGGIRGLLSLVLLDRIGKEIPGWLDKADPSTGSGRAYWLARQSAFVRKLRLDAAGGIIALGIAHGVPLADIRALYEQKGRDMRLRPCHPKLRRGTREPGRFAPVMVPDVSAVALAKAEVLPQLPRPGQ